MTAAEARQIADEAQPREDPQIQKVLELIKNAAEGRNYAVALDNEWLTTNTQAKLSELGYTFQNDDNGKDRWAMISW